MSKNDCFLTIKEFETNCISSRDFKKEYELGEILRKDNGATLHIQYFKSSMSPILAFTYNPKNSNIFWNW